MLFIISKVPPKSLPREGHDRHLPKCSRATASSGRTQVVITTFMRFFTICCSRKSERKPHWQPHISQLHLFSSPCWQSRDRRQLTVIYLHRQRELRWPRKISQDSTLEQTSLTRARVKQKFGIPLHPAPAAASTLRSVFSSQAQAELC